VRQEHHHLEAKGAGHYGIFSGRRWRDVVYPHVKSFILEHNKGEGKGVVKAAASKPKALAKKAPPAVKRTASVAAKAEPVAKKAAAKPAAKKAPAAQK
jgi:poly(3-hydroxybutyrate) depolymerase